MGKNKKESDQKKRNMEKTYRPVYHGRHGEYRERHNDH
jgi:hypothetical protein